MAFFGKCRKADLINLAKELNIDIPDEATIVQIKNAVIKSKEYDEEFTREVLNSLAKQREEMEVENRRRLEKIPEVVTQPMTFSKQDLTKLIAKFNEGDDVTTYLAIFERQIQRLPVAQEDYVAILLGLVPLRIARVINQLDENSSYEEVKKILLKLFGCSQERYKKDFFYKQKDPKQSWREYAFELKTFFMEWTGAVEVNTFDDLVELMVTEKIKNRTAEEFKNHYVEKLPKVKKSEELINLIEEFEMAKMRPLIQKTGGDATWPQRQYKKSPMSVTSRSWVPQPRMWVPQPRMQVPGPHQRRPWSGYAGQQQQRPWFGQQYRSSYRPESAQQWKKTDNQTPGQATSNFMKKDKDRPTS